MCGSLFGGTETPKTKNVAPAATVQSGETGTIATSVADEVDKNRKKRGYAATRTSTDRDTVVGGAGKTTLG